MKSLETILAKARGDLGKQFNLDQKVKSFIDEYRLANQIEIPEQDPKTAKLTTETIEGIRLAKTRLESEEVPEQEILDELKAGSLNWLRENIGEEKALKIELQPELEKLEDGYDVSIKLKGPKGSVEFSPDSLMYRKSQGWNGSPLREFAVFGGEQNPNWAAWIGDPRSPFYSKDLEKEYSDALVLTNLRDLISTLDATMYFEELAEKARKVV